MNTLIKNGTLIDPANHIYSKLNLLVQDGKIAAATTEAPSADQVIDADGKIVSPGFIDIHMHEDHVEADGHIRYQIYESMLRMGVTTAVGGNCGENVYDPLKYLDLVDQDGAPVNVILFAGHQYYREKAGALDKYAPITEEQLAAMKQDLKKALDGGCVGISYGIRYVPGINRRELLETASCCVPDHRLISAHVRNDAAYIFESVEEAADIGRQLHIPVEISHIGSMGGFGQMEQLMRQIDACRADGLDISCDCYPYFAFSTGIGETTYDDGWLERYHCDYDVCELAEGKYKGKRCTPEIFAEMRKDFPECLTICYVMRDDDVRLALNHPNVMVASDGVLSDGQGHPRASGTFPRFLAEFVRNGSISLYDGISKMSLMPAERLGLTRKGRLNAGADADITIFDPNNVQDCATFDQPLLPPVGIEHVLLNGELVLTNGRVIKNRAGRSIRF